MNGYTFSNSERRAFVSCERRWNYSFQRGWAPRTISVPMAFGRLWDDSLNVVYEYVKHIQDKGDLANVVRGDLGAVCDMLANEVCDGRGALLGHIPSAPERGVLNEWVQERADELGEAAEKGWTADGPSYTMADVWEQEGIFRSMLRRYLRRYLGDDVGGLRILAVQPTLKASMRTAAGNKSTRFSYAGIPDQVVEDPDSGLIWILEQKSTGMSAVSRESDLRVDPQGLSYCWLLWRAAGVPLERIGGVIYSIGRRKEPSVPKRLKCKKRPKCACVTNADAFGDPGRSCPTCAGTKQDHEGCDSCDGRGLRGVSLAECDTTPEAYIEAMQMAPEWIEDEHNEVVSRLEAKRARWFHRFSVRVHPSEILGLEREIYQTGRLAGEGMRRSTLEAPRNVGACMVAGRTCSYVALCRTGSGFDGTDDMAHAFGFVQRDKNDHHGEPNTWAWRGE